ncbi:MAG: alpha/beta fold hydrolase [Flavobacteriales bacterium]|nr:alpha/beta fold hydrolase [Flavobacteriales bacterium]
MTAVEPYTPPFLHRWAHSATILPNQLRPITSPYHRSESIETPDGDLFTLDWIDRAPDQLAVLLHGLEGSTKSSYMMGMAKAFAARGWSVASVNHRSCGGTPNMVIGSYHSGFTTDLELILQRCSSVERVVIVGFSLGGNIALKRAGEALLPPNVKAVIGISVPLHLASSARKLARWQNAVYMTRFLRQLKRKALIKSRQFPSGGLNDTALQRAKTFEEFDEAYTAPAHGFDSASDYYERSSAIRFLPSIKTPSLIINALNDSFLTEQCYPYEATEQNPFLHMDVPSFGGHVGFAQSHFMRDEFWHERRVMEFIQTFGA